MAVLAQMPIVHSGVDSNIEQVLDQACALPLGASSLNLTPRLSTPRPPPKTELFGANNPFRPLPLSASVQPRPWLPPHRVECQFKICDSCRKLMRERSWLSLDGIVNGDIPASVITGFGFHLDRKRPVSLVKHVENIGLRAVPIKRV